MGFLHAVRAREYCASDAPGGVEVWKYSFPLTDSRLVDDIHVRFETAGSAPGLKGPQWIGIFECATARHVDVIPWPAANAIVVAAANAVYIVDPSARLENFEVASSRRSRSTALLSTNRRGRCSSRKASVYMRFRRTGVSAGFLSRWMVTTRIFAAVAAGCSGGRAKTIGTAIRKAKRRFRL